MKNISKIFILFTLLALVLIGFKEGQWSPLIGLILSYACYKTVFSFSTQEKLYDPIDFVQE